MTRSFFVPDISALGRPVSKEEQPRFTMTTTVRTGVSTSRVAYDLFLSDCLVARGFGKTLLEGHHLQNGQIVLDCGNGLLLHVKYAPPVGITSNKIQVFRLKAGVKDNQLSKTDLIPISMSAPLFDYISVAINWKDWPHSERHILVEMYAHPLETTFDTADLSNLATVTWRIGSSRGRQTQAVSCMLAPVPPSPHAGTMSLATSAHGQQAAHHGPTKEGKVPAVQANPSGGNGTSHMSIDDNSVDPVASGRRPKSATSLPHPHPNILSSSNASHATLDQKKKTVTFNGMDEVRILSDTANTGASEAGHNVTQSTPMKTNDDRLAVGQEDGVKSGAKPLKKRAVTILDGGIQPATSDVTEGRGHQVQGGAAMPNLTAEREHEILGGGAATPSISTTDAKFKALELLASAATAPDVVDMGVSATKEPIVVLVPGLFDVLSGAGRPRDADNAFYKQLLAKYAQEFAACTSAEEIKVANKLIKDVESKEGRFLSWHVDEWKELQSSSKKKKVKKDLARVSEKTTNHTATTTAAAPTYVDTDGTLSDTLL